MGDSDHTSNRGNISLAGRSARWIELVVLFGGGPLLFRLEVLSSRGLFPMMIGGGVICLLALAFDRGFDHRRLWRLAGLKQEAGRIVRLFVIGASLMALITLGLIALRETGAIDLNRHVRMFSLMRRAPGWWIAIMVLYPLVSVYPQELIYRAFFFRRYRAILAEGWPRVLGSAIAFAWAHVIFREHVWVPIGLTLVGGLLFAWTYHRSRSLAAAWFEHSLYGCFVFTIGIGSLFYNGPSG